MRIGICGLGMMGRSHLANALKIDELEVAALCDIDPAKFDLSRIVPGNLPLEQVKSSLDNVPRYEQYEQMLDEAELDAMIVTTPSDLHPSMATAALEAGLHVFTEKPIAVTVEGGERVYRAVEASGKVLVVGHVVRFIPAYQKLGEWVRNQTWGPVVSAEFSRSCGLPGWGERGWFTDPARSGGMPVDLHIHDADFILHTFGPPPAVRSVRSFNSPSQTDIIETLYIYNEMPVRSWGGWVHRTSGFSAWANITFEEATVSYNTRQGDHIAVYHHDESEAVELSDAGGYETELREFVRCARAGHPSPVCPPKSAVDSLRLVYAEMESAEKNTEVTPDITPDSD